MAVGMTHVVGKEAQLRHQIALQLSIATQTSDFLPKCSGGDKSTAIASLHGFSTRKFSSTKASISLFEKVCKALAGVFTMGSPFRLNEVFNTTGTPVA